MLGFPAVSHEVEEPAINALNAGLVVAIALIGLSDFLLGESGRTRIRDAFLRLWLLLEDNSLSVVLAMTTAVGIRVLGRIFGRRFGLRQIATVGVMVIPVTMWCLCYCQVTGSHALTSWVNETKTEPPKITWELFLAWLAGSATVALPWYGKVGPLAIPWVVAVAMYAIALRLLSIVATRASAVRLLVATAGASVAGIALWWIAGEVVISILLGPERRDDLLTFFVLELPISLTNLIGVFPAGIVICFGLTAMAVKILNPVIGPPVKLLVRRLAEAERGALTLVAAGLSGIVKLIELML